jgi:predicted ATPase
MEGFKFIRSIRLENLLSYGPRTPELALEPLNVLIGPNASGKSNLIEALSILAAASKDLQVPIREGGGVRDWLWKGSAKPATASIEATLFHPAGPMPLRYRLRFSEVGARFTLVDEAIENERPSGPNQKPYFFYAYQNGRPAINVRTALDDGSPPNYRQLRREDVSPEQSILSQRRDPDIYPELTYVAGQFERMRFYREWNLGRYTAPRLPQKTDLPQDGLLEDASNLGLVLNDLQNQPEVKQQILDRLRAFYARVTDVTTKIQGGTVQIFFHEQGLKHPVPGTRLSDGSLRYLCLLVVLCHPAPPPVVCIEEPELGLHPDVIPEVAKMLLEAASRTQLFVTTHSDALVDALSESPEVIVVCERGDQGTELRRLESKQLAEWLERYRLGELWQMGELGGNPR